MTPDGTRDSAPRRRRAGSSAPASRNRSLRELAATTGGRYLRSRDRRRPAPRRCTRSRRRERKLVGYRTTTEYRDLYPAALAGRRRSRSDAWCSCYDLEQHANSAQLNTQAAGEIVAVLEHEIAKVIVGQHTLIRRMLTALFAAIPFAVVAGTRASGCGHLLLEGVPGVAKTLTATTLAQGDLGAVPARPAHA